MTGTPQGGKKAAETRGKKDPKAFEKTGSESHKNQDKKESGGRS